MSTRTLALATALATAPAAVVLAAAPAQAAGHTVVFMNGSQMVVQSGAGGANWITINNATLPNGGPAYLVRDNTPGATMTTTSPCQVASSASVMCPKSLVSSYDVTSGDLNDVIQFPALALAGVVHAGAATIGSSREPVRRTSSETPAATPSTIAPGPRPCR
ncbi:hypothetical protein D0Z08_24015 [Nocardioides immobilis]|uniref:Uncharacterized protein n=1 Tax=Nocardioides immobilis TaxID=2049295 RepID=A0A417XW44_9ACTN|nr:hypothetical protein [Nocardioides immobilis]RHW24586.1 hypothetical protein D0Z08_24015 [Nocardioides immobilis]